MVNLVRAEGLEPSRALRPNGFSYPSTAFAALAFSSWGSGLSLHRARIWLRVSGAARLVSTPFPTVSGRAWLGIAMLRGFPEFEQFCIAGFPASTQVSRLSPVRLPIPPRPHGFKLARCRKAQAHAKPGVHRRGRLQAASCFGSASRKSGNCCQKCSISLTAPPTVARNSSRWDGFWMRRTL